MSAQHGAFHVGQIELSLIFVHGAERAVVTRTSSQGFEAKQVAGVLAGHRIYTARSNGNQRQEPKKGCSTLSDRTAAF